MAYIRRVIDDELDDLLTGLPAVTVEGPKAVGKTETALQRAETVRRFDDPAQASVARADPTRAVSGSPPVLLDEWQRVPEVWDAVRRAVDSDPEPGRFLLTGSAAPESPETHSGAGRIVRLRLRPMSLAERGLGPPTVRLRDLLKGGAASLEGETALGLEEYAEEIVASGFPAIRTLAGRARREQLDGYLARVVDRDFEEVGQAVRKPETLRRWMAAYAAASSTTANLETIRDAATPGEADKPARSTVIQYREVLHRLWLLDPVPAWVPSRNYFSRLARPEKHQLADPALAARLLGVGVGTLVEGGEGAATVPRDGTLLGHLFEIDITGQGKRGKHRVMAMFVFYGRKYLIQRLQILPGFQGIISVKPVVCLKTRLIQIFPRFLGIEPYIAVIIYRKYHQLPVSPPAGDVFEVI